MNALTTIDDTPLRCCPTCGAIQGAVGLIGHVGPHKLTMTESRAFTALLRANGRRLTYLDLAKAMWPTIQPGCPNEGIRSALSRLRRKVVDEGWLITGHQRHGWVMTRPTP